MQRFVMHSFTHAMVFNAQFPICIGFQWTSSHMQMFSIHMFTHAIVFMHTFTHAMVFNAQARTCKGFSMHKLTYAIVFNAHLDYASFSGKLFQWMINHTWNNCQCTSSHMQMFSMPRFTHGGVYSTMIRAADLWSSVYRVARSRPPVFICVEIIGQHWSLRNASGHPEVMGTWWLRA